MNFVRSRLTAVGLLAAWPLAQMVGCAAKDRDFGPTNTAGDDGSGGTGNNGQGGASGSSGKGGSNGGTGATGGSSSGGGAGVEDNGGSGGTDVGSGGTAGAVEPGTGGTAGTSEPGGGGEGGQREPAPGCVATGDELCADGLDNDCDGTTDCLEIDSEFPTRNGAASGSDVAYTFKAVAPTATFQCRQTRGDSPSGSWSTCQRVEGTTINPFSTAQAQAPARDGLWTTEVRLRFPDGGLSDSFRRTVYVHSSLYDVPRCPVNASTAAWVGAAQTYLADAGTFDTSTVRNPFVQIDFDPPVNTKFTVAEGDGTVRWSSLRRQFSFSADRRYLVMTRTYTSRNASGMGCAAMGKRTHVAHGSSAWQTSSATYMTYETCDAVVFNKKGAGYCLGFIGGSIVSAERLKMAGADDVPAPNYSPAADNFAWRKMTARVAAAGGGLSTNLSPKCDEDGCSTDPYILFLPDKAYFPYWGD